MLRTRDAIVGSALCLSAITVASTSRADGPNGSSSAPSGAAVPWGANGGPAPATAPTSASPPAAQTTAPSAPDPNLNELTLRDGQVVRGRMQTLRPNEFVVVVGTDGQPRVIRWWQIARATGPSFPGGYVAANPAPPPSPAYPQYGATPQNAYAPYGQAPTMYAPAGYAPPQPPPPDESVLALRPGEGRVPLLLVSWGGTVVIGLPRAVDTGFGVYPVYDRPTCHTPCTLYVRPGPIRFATISRNSRATFSNLVVTASGTRARFAVPTRRQRWRRLIVGLSGVSGIGTGIVLGAVAIAHSSSYPVPRDTSALFASAGTFIGAGIVLGLVSLGMRLSESPRIESVESLDPSEETDAGANHASIDAPASVTSSSALRADIGFSWGARF